MEIVICLRCCISHTLKNYGLGLRADIAAKLDVDFAGFDAALSLCNEICQISGNDGFLELMSQPINVKAQVGISS